MSYLQKTVIALYVGGILLVLVGGLWIYLAHRLSGYMEGQLYYFRDHGIELSTTPLISEPDSASLVEELTNAGANLSSWVKHTVPTWTTEVDESLEAVDKLVIRARELATSKSSNETDSAKDEE